MPRIPGGIGVTKGVALAESDVDGPVVQYWLIPELYGHVLPNLQFFSWIPLFDPGLYISCLPATFGDLDRPLWFVYGTAVQHLCADAALKHCFVYLVYPASLAEQTGSRIPFSIGFSAVQLGDGSENSSCSIGDRGRNGSNAIPIDGNRFVFALW